MLATDPLSLVFIACFLFGLLFFVATALLGNLGHGHAGIHATPHHVTPHIGGHASVSHTASTHAISHGTAHNAHATSNAHAHNTQTHNSALLSYINPTSFMIFLLGFGFIGYVLHTLGHFVIALTLTLAGISGIIVAVLLLLLLSRLFGDSEGATVQDVSDRTGMLGKVSIPIPEGGLGEIIYISPGGLRKSIPARSIDGHRLERGQEVVVVDYERGVAEVDTWEHFMSEEEPHPKTDTDISDELEKLRALLDESNSTGSELVIRKDQQ